MAIYGTVQTVKAQSPRTPAFAKAWAYVEELLQPGSAAHQRMMALTAGSSQKHELGDGVFTIEQAYDTKPRAEGFFESHRKNIDVQVIFAGTETMEALDIAHAKVRDAYVEQKDLIVFEDAAGASLLKLGAGDVAVFFPADVHMPGIRSSASPVLVRKAVVKIPVGA